MEKNITRYGIWHGIFATFFGSLLVFAIHFIIEYEQIIFVLVDSPGPISGFVYLWYSIGPCLLFLLLIVPVIYLCRLGSIGIYQSILVDAEQPERKVFFIWAILGAVMGSIGAQLTLLLLLGGKEPIMTIGLIGGVIGLALSIFIVARIIKYVREQTDYS